MRSRGGRKRRPYKRRYPPVIVITRAMDLVLPYRANALEGMRWKPNQKIDRLDMMKNEINKERR